MPKLKYVWHHPDKDPRNFVKMGLKPPTMFGEPIGGKNPLRRECPQVYINEDFPQIACCTKELGLDRTGHMSFLTGQDRTPKFAGQVMPDWTESGLIILNILPYK